MTTPATSTLRAAIEFGSPSEAGAARTNALALFFDLPVRKTAPGFVDIDDVVERLARRHGLQEEIETARHELAASVANPLAAIRLACGLSQRELGDRAGTSQSYISQLEQGERDPGTDMIQRVAQAMDTTSERIFSAVRAIRFTRGVDRHA